MANFEDTDWSYVATVMAETKGLAADTAKEFSTFSDKVVLLADTYKNISDRRLISDEDVTAADALSELNKKIADAGISAARASQLRAKAESTLVKVENAGLNVSKEKKKLEEDLLKLIKEKVAQEDKGLIRKVKESNVFQQSAQRLRKMQGHASKFTSEWAGASFSIGGVVALLISVYNEMRRIEGMAMQAAGRFGGGVKEINKARAGIFGLRSAFSMSFDEAGKLITSLTDMGFRADDLVSKRFAERTFKMPTEALDEAVQYEIELKKQHDTVADVIALRDKGIKLAQQQAKLIQEHNEAEKKRKKNFSETVGLAQELHALQLKYGVAVGTSANVIRTLQREYGKAHEASRGMLGAAVQTAIALKESGVPIGIEEVIADWGELISKVKIYKTDLLGVLSLYNTLMRKDLSSSIGLGGVPLSVKKGIASGLMSIPLQMSLGWKAKLGVGESPAARALEFEQTAAEKPMEALARITKVTRDLSGRAGTAQANIKARSMLESMGVFNPEQIQVLARKMTSGNMTSDKIKAAQQAALAEAQKMKDLAKSWPEDRKQMVDYAGKISRKLQTLQELFKKWASTELMPVVRDIINILEKIYYALPGTEEPVASGLGAKLNLEISESQLGRWLSKTPEATLAGAFTKGAMFRAYDPANPFTASAMAVRLPEYGAPNFKSKFKQITGVSEKEYLEYERRMKKQVLAERIEKAFGYARSFGPSTTEKLRRAFERNENYFLRLVDELVNKRFRDARTAGRKQGRPSGTRRTLTGKKPTE